MAIFLQTDPEQRRLMNDFNQKLEAQLMWGKDAINHLAKLPTKRKKKTRRKQSKKHCVVYNGKGIWEQLREPGQVYAPKELTLENLTSTIKDFFHGKQKKQDPIDLWKMTAKPDMPLLKLVSKNPLSGQYVAGIDPYKMKQTRRKMKSSKPGIDGQAFKVQLMDSDTWKWELPVPRPTNLPVIVETSTRMI
jgi:hypothetical protein